MSNPNSDNFPQNTYPGFGTNTFTLPPNAVLKGNTTIGDAASDTLSLVAKTTVSGDQKIQFRDSGIYIHSSADGHLDIVADTSIDLSGPTTFDNSLELTGADKSITFSGTNTATVPAFVFPDDTYIADADGSVGATAGFIVVKIGNTNYKLQTYAMS